MSETSLREQLETSLGVLGTRATEIRTSLANKGVTGQRGTSSMCVIAEYLKEQFPEYQVRVSGASATLFRGHVALGCGCQLCGSDDAFAAARVGFGQPGFHGFRTFISHFDDGRYPDLIKEAS